MCSFSCSLIIRLVIVIASNPSCFIRAEIKGGLPPIKKLIKLVGQSECLCFSLSLRAKKKKRMDGSPIFKESWLMFSNLSLLLTGIVKVREEGIWPQDLHTERVETIVHVRI